MPAIPSRMVELGTKAPGFALEDTDGKLVRFENVRGIRGTLVIFMCNHCPYVIHIQKELVDFSKIAIGKGVGVVGINSNDTDNYPEDSIEKMRMRKKELGYPFPYLLDADQKVAQKYEAACTPDFFLFDKSDRLVYRGQFDDSRPKSSIPVTGNDLGKAILLLSEDKPIPNNQKPSLGCSIKWKPGNEPRY